MFKQSLCCGVNGVLRVLEETADRVADSLRDASVLLIPLFIRRLVIINLQWLPEGEADRRESNSVAHFRPGVEGAPDCDGDDRNMKFARQDGSSLLEYLQLPVATQ